MPTKYSLLLCIALSVVFLDQYTKHLAVQYLTEPENPCKKELVSCEERCRKADPSAVASAIACQKVCATHERRCHLAFQETAIAAWKTRRDDLKRSLWCRHVQSPESSLPECVVVNGFFHFHYRTNRGAAWGMFSSYPESFRRPFFMTITVLALLFMTYLFVFLIHREHKLMIIALSSILGGALGNFVDRVRLGYVVDFIFWFFPYGKNQTYPWPTFNIADAAISIGVSLIFYELLFHRERVTSTADSPGSLPSAFGTPPAAPSALEASPSSGFVASSDSSTSTPAKASEEANVLAERAEGSLEGLAPREPEEPTSSSLSPLSPPPSNAAQS